MQSTNSTAYQLAERGAEPWTIVVADRQTEGRGRSGRKWESPKGGLWFSIILRPRIPSAKLPMLQFLAANAARKALEDKTHLMVLVKWPNDLVLKTGKIGGILIEAKIIDERVIFAVVGIGLNVNLLRRQLPPGATSTYLETGTRYENRKLLRSIVNQLSSKYANLYKPATVVKEWWRHCIHNSMAVEVMSQYKTLTGIARKVEEDGSLIIEVDDHELARVGEGSLRLLE